MRSSCSLLLLLLPAALAAKCGEVDKKACDGVCRTLKNQVPRPYLYELCQEGCNTRLNQGKADIRKANKVASAHCQHGGFSHACKSGWFGMHDLFTSCTPDGTFASRTCRRCLLCYQQRFEPQAATPARPMILALPHTRPPRCPPSPRPVIPVQTRSGARWRRMPRRRPTSSPCSRTRSRRRYGKNTWNRS